MLDENNYVDPESQPDLTHDYSDANNTVNITWQTVTKEISRSQSSRNYVRTPLEAFQLFFSGEMVENILKFSKCGSRNRHFLQFLLNLISIHISKQLIVAILEFILEKYIWELLLEWIYSTDQQFKTMKVLVITLVQQCWRNVEFISL